MSELNNVFNNQAADFVLEDKGYEYPHLQYTSETEHAKLQSVINKLAKSPLGKELLDDATAYGTEIRLDSMCGIWGAFAYNEKKLRINKDASEDRLVATLAHELRHSQQFQKGVNMDVLHDDPRCYLHSQCVIEADANVASCLVAWDLEKQGQAGVRETLLAEEKPVFKKFFECADNDGSADKSAPNKAFYAWFSDMRIRQAYENNYAKSVEYCKSHRSYQDKEPIFSRQTSVQDNIEKVCTIAGKPYVGKEAEAFFKRPDMNELNNETYWTVFRAMRDAKRFDWGDAEKQMSDYGLKKRAQEYYEVANTPSIEKRQQNAAQTIRQKRTQKEASVVSALLAKGRSRG